MQNQQNSKSSWGNNGRDTFSAVSSCEEKLPSALYTLVRFIDGSYGYTKKEVKTDELLCFPDSVCSKIISEIDHFWSIGDTFAKYNILHRRGYLLYGPPGSGKTAITEQIVDATIKAGGVAFLCNHPEHLSGGLAWFRKYEPNRKIVCIFEDIDAIINNFSEDTLLSCLDGENQVNHVLNVATTNYPEELDRRIINRPRRFDQIIKIGYPERNLRQNYFLTKLNLSPDEVEKWVEASEGFSFAACTDLLINVKCFGHTLADSAVRVRKTLEYNPDSKDDFS
jgi:ATPase family associated with various cellular activities (AAA)